MGESLGKYLSASRIKQGLSIEEVASVTRVNEKFIRWMENDQFIELPGDVFIKGFLRTYAKQLGLDGGKLVARYVALNIEHNDHTPDLISIPLRPKSSSLPLIALLIILIGLGAFAYYHYQEKGIAFLNPNYKKVIKPKPVKVDKAKEIKEIKPEASKISGTTAPAIDKEPAAPEKPKTSQPAKKEKTQEKTVKP